MKNLVRPAKIQKVKETTILELTMRCLSWEYQFNYNTKCITSIYLEPCGIKTTLTDYSSFYEVMNAGLSQYFDLLKVSNFSTKERDEQILFNSNVDKIVTKTAKRKATDDEILKYNTRLELVFEKEVLKAKKELNKLLKQIKIVDLFVYESRNYTKGSKGHYDFNGISTGFSSTKTTHRSCNKIVKNGVVVDSIFAINSLIDFFNK